MASSHPLQGKTAAVTLPMLDQPYTALMERVIDIFTGP